MKEFINSVYSSQYFVTGLFIAIAVLTVMFFVILIMAIKDAKKNQMEDEETEVVPNPISNEPTLAQTNSQPIINPKEFVFTSEIKMPPTTAPQVAPIPEAIALPPAESANPLDLIENAIAQNQFTFPVSQAQEPVVKPTVTTTEFVMPPVAPASFPKEETISPLPPVVNNPVPTMNQPTSNQDQFSNTMRISLPDQFSSVYVEPKTDQPKRTIEFEIQQPAPIIPEPIAQPITPIPEAPIAQPVIPTPPAPKSLEFEVKPAALDINQLQQAAINQISDSSVVASQMPKLAKEEMPLPKQPEVQEFDFNIINNIENETYQINRH